MFSEENKEFYDYPEIKFIDKKYENNKILRHSEIIKNVETSLKNLKLQCIHKSKTEDQKCIYVFKFEFLGVIDFVKVIRLRNNPKTLFSNVKVEILKRLEYNLFKNVNNYFTDLTTDEDFKIKFLDIDKDFQVSHFSDYEYFNELLLKGKIKYDKKSQRNLGCDVYVTGVSEMIKLNWLYYNDIEKAFCVIIQNV